MKVSDLVWCGSFACIDVDHDRYTVPPGLADPDSVTVVMVAEAPPADPADWFYAGDEALYARTTVQAFRDAGEDVSSIDDVVALGVYLTTAVKCGKTAYGISTETIRDCSLLLEQELGLFPLEEAIHRMTGLPARRFNLRERGEIAPGKHADLVVFDPQRVIDRATYAEPTLAAEGIDYVMVAGTLAYGPGGATGNRAGRFLRRHAMS